MGASRWTMRCILSSLEVVSLHPRARIKSSSGINYANPQSTIESLLSLAASFTDLPANGDSGFSFLD